MVDVKNLPEKTRFLIQLFYLNKKLRVADVKNALGASMLADLSNLGLLISKGHYIESEYGIACFNNHYFIHGYDDIDLKDYAYWGSDTDILARHLPFNFNARKVLDLCTGTGIQAILLSKSAKKIIGVELSPGAAYVARFNTILNNVENKVKILQGDLYKPVKNKKFDLIVSNPPFIPVPDTLAYPLSGRGGEDGLLVLKSIFSNINKYMTKNGIGLLLGVTFGDCRVPFIISLLKRIAKTNKLDVDLVILQRAPKREEISIRKNLLLHYNQNHEVDPEKEMSRIYNKAKAEYLYTYLVKLRRGRGSVNSLDLFDKNYIKKNIEKTGNAFLMSLDRQFKLGFINKHYNKAIKTLNNMEKLCKIFGLKYTGEISFNLGVCYQRLGQYKEAIAEFKKAEKMSSKNFRINFLLARCYRDIGDIKRFNKELDEGFLKFKHLDRTKIAKN
jgi:tRNA1(Val) A37 N6-methylase TrmN6